MFLGLEGSGLTLESGGVQKPSPPSQQKEAFQE